MPREGSSLMGGETVAGGAGRTRGHVRLFVASDLPESVRGALADWGAERGRAIRGLRLIDERHLHVTLCFLGWRPEAEVGEIRATCRSATTADRPNIPLSVTEALWLPPRRPRVLAIELADADGRLAALQSTLASALQARGFYEPESRPFLAHVTVARVQRGVRVRPGPLPAPEVAPFAAEAVTLYRSHLRRAGARYEALETIPLGRPSVDDRPAGWATRKSDGPAP